MGSRHGGTAGRQRPRRQCGPEGRERNPQRPSDPAGALLRICHDTGCSVYGCLAISTEQITMCCLPACRSRRLVMFPHAICEGWVKGWVIE